MASSSLSPAVQAFLAQYLSATDLQHINAPSTPSESLKNKILLIDGPIKYADQYISEICCNIHWKSYSRPSIIVGNELGAIIGALISVGYSEMEILSIRSKPGLSDLDIVSLIEGNQILPDKLHRLTKDGAAHKGLRLRDALNDLIRAKIGKSGPMVTFSDLHAFSQCFLAVKVFSTRMNGVITISHLNYPDMPIADAVLASCALPSYIMAVIDPLSTDAKDPDLFVSCTMMDTLNTDDAFNAARAIGMRGTIEEKIVGYGFISSNSGHDAERVNGMAATFVGYRRPALFDRNLSRYITLFDASGMEVTADAI